MRRMVTAIMKTTAARLSALYLLLFAICATVLVFYMTSLSERMLLTQTQETINEEMMGLASAYQRGGLPLLVRTVERRAHQPGANLYLVAEPSGRILSGNVESLDAGVLDGEGWTVRPFSYQRYGDGGVADRNAAGAEARSDHHEAVALVLRLPNRMIVMVGRDLGEPLLFREVMHRALISSLGAMSLGGLVIWYLVGRRALKRIDGVSAASARIMGGDLGGRLPISGSGDEFDRLSENLNAMLSRIATLNEGLKQVSDNIAHDLKTPLTRLRNKAEAAMAGQKEPGEYRMVLESIIAESDQLIRTFQAILMISRLEAGYSSETVAKVDLVELAQGVVELYEPTAEEEGVVLDAELDGAYEIDGNRELVAQALSNIVDNAIKYSVGPEGKSRVVVRLSRRDGEVRLVIDDNGPGIPGEADRIRVKERFVRLEKSRSQTGSGLGLSLADAVMKFHGGRLELSPGDPGLSVAMVFPEQ